MEHGSLVAIARLGGKSKPDLCDSVIKPQWKAGELATCGSASFPVCKSSLDLRCHLQGVHKRGTQTGGGQDWLKYAWQLAERENRPAMCPRSAAGHGAFLSDLL